MRIIPRIDIKNDYVIKGINLEGLRKIGDPKSIIENYSSDYADEILIMDSVASLYGRNNLFDFIEEITKEIFIPITLGGGINNLRDVEKALNSGADKVAINSGAINDKKLIKEASRIFGSSTIISSIEAKKIDHNKWEPYTNCGREKSGLNLIDWIKKVQNDGCGEIILTSIDNEGTENGFDIDLLKSTYDIIYKPIILCGGCGSVEDIKYIKENFDDCSVSIASILHYKKTTIKNLKNKLVL
jgi:cyclase